MNALPRVEAQAPSVRGLALLLWSAEPSQPQRLATPFFHAAAAAAMALEVEVYFSAASVRLLQPGVAASLHADPAHPKTVAQAMEEALAHGAVFYACTDALAAHGLVGVDLFPGAVRRGGAVQFVARACDPAWRALVF